jgi:nucleoside-diphosphate-sugar epimerase
VPRYVYAGSAHVYPVELQVSVDCPLIHEDQAIPAHPELSYGWAKLLGEKLIEFQVEQGCETRAAIVRLIGVYGKNQDIELATASALPAFCRRAIEYPKKGPFRVWGTGAETRAYCHVDDVIDGVLLCVQKLHERKLIGPINLGCEDVISIGDLARLVIEISKKKIDMEFDTSIPSQFLNIAEQMAVHKGRALTRGAPEAMGASVRSRPCAILVY